MKEQKKTKIYKKWWFWICIVMLIAIIIIIIANLTYNNNQTYKSKKSSSTEQNITKEHKEAETVKEKKTKAQEEKEFKNSCKTYTYKEIARNPDKYKGKNIKLTGEVIQVLEGYFNSVELRIDMTKDEYGYYDDTIYATYTYSDGENKILEDDIVTIYGTCQGTTSYESIFGEKITLPQIDIEYLTIKE